jgi:hypothetical protein
MALCFYAIVRFIPFVETEEFANVGVVLYAPSKNYFGFKVLTNRLGRITAFFEHIEGPLLRRTMKDVWAELDRIARQFDALARHDRADAGMSLWRELLKPKSSQIVLSSERVVLAERPQEQVGELFKRYIEHGFVTPEYIERALERRVSGWLRADKLDRRFREGVIGNDAFKVRFPFVARDAAGATRVIKPLALTQFDSVRILEHGGPWIQRLHNLRKRDLLPEQILFVYDGDAAEDTQRGEARRDVLSELKALTVQTLPIAESPAVLAFAAEAQGA